MPFKKLPPELSALIRLDIETWDNHLIAPLTLVSRYHQQMYIPVLYRTVVLASARAVAAFLVLAGSAVSDGQDRKVHPRPVLEHVRSLSLWRASDEPEYMDYLADGQTIINACPNLVNLQLSPLNAPTDLMLLALEPRVQRLFTFDTIMGASLLGSRPEALTLNNPATHLYLADVDSFAIAAVVSPLAFPHLTVFSTTCPGWYMRPVAARLALAVKGVLKLPTIHRVLIRLVWADDADHKSSLVWEALRDLGDARVFAARASPDLTSQWRAGFLDMWRRDVTGVESMWETGEQVCPAT